MLLPVEVGARAPDFALKDQNNQVLRLSDFRGRKSVLLIFYPLAFTGICQGELHRIQNQLDRYANERLQVLAISVDSVYAHKVWAEREGFRFPLLADFWPHGAVAREYGVFDDAAGFAHRGTFLIDQNGMVRFADVLPPGRTRDDAAWSAALAALDVPGLSGVAGPSGASGVPGPPAA